MKKEKKNVFGSDEHRFSIYELLVAEDSREVQEMLMARLNFERNY